VGGQTGRLEIIYEAGRWFAYIPIEVGVDPPKSNLKGYVKPNYRDEKGRIFNPKSIKQRDPVGDKKAFIDVGLNNLFASSSLRRISIAQSKEDLLNLNTTGGKERSLHIRLLEICLKTLGSIDG
jgi:transposase